MKKIWYALLYGDGRTKRCIGGVLLFSIFGVISFGIGIVIQNFVVMALGLIFGVVALIISQTFTLVEDNYVAEVGMGKQKKTIRTVSAAKEENFDSKEPIEQTKKQKAQELFEELAKKEAIYSQYDSVKMKAVKKQHHVKKDHRPILIDYSESYGIKECPAFIWRVHNKVFLLLIEEEPRKICISRELIRNMGYEPKVPGSKEREYLAFRNENLITKVFGEFVPDYYDKRTKTGNVRYKNLYTIYPDIQISNRSAFQVMDLLYLNFMPKDKITESDKFNGYFKRIYAAHILFTDKVYSITEYKDKVETVLKELCYSDVPEPEFIVTLENLVKGRMISQEYADHYTELREKVTGKQVKTTYRR